MSRNEPRFSRPDSSGMKSQARGLDAPLLIIPTSKQEQIQKDVEANLFHLPKEEEILEEMEEVERVRDMEGQWQDMKRQQEFQQNQVQNKKLLRIEDEQKRLALRYEELVNEPQLDNQESKYQLIALKRRIEQDYRDEAKKLEDQFLYNKELEMERIVRKKIEAEQLIEKQKKMNSDMQRLQAELEAIEEVKNRKDINSKAMLEQALKRRGGDTLAHNDFLTDKDKVLLADAVLDDRLQGERQKELILMDVQSKISQQRNKAQMEQQNKLRQLNELRSTIADKQERILKEKALHGEVISRGIEFLTEVELGNAPPMEYIKKNINLSEDKLDEYRNNVGVPQIIKKGRMFVASTENRVMSIKQSQRESKFQVQPYNGEIKPILNEKNPESLFIVRKAVQIMIDFSLRKILETENRFIQLDRMKFEYRGRDEELQELQKQKNDEQDILQLCDEIFQRVLLKVQREAATEIATVNLLAKSVALNIIVNSIKTERNTQNTVNRLQKLYTDLRNPDTLEKIGQTIKFNFKTQKEIDWKKVKRGKKNYQQVEKEKVKEEKKTAGKQLINDQQKDFLKNQDEPDVKENDNDLDVIVLDPEKDCSDSLGVERVKDYEAQYWQQVTFQYLSFRDHSASIKYSVTFLCMSPFKEFIFAGMSNGEVYMYDAVSSPTIIVAIIPSTTKSPVVDIQFGMDNIGHLNVIDEAGSSKFCYNAYNLKVNVPKEILKGIEKQKESFKPMFYLEYQTFTYKHFVRNKEAKEDVKNFAINCSVFHPGITFSCLQPTLLLGTQNGTIMKFNTNKDLYSGKTYKLPIHNVLNSKIIVNEDQPFPENIWNFLEIEKNPPGKSDGQNSHVFREFFLGHRFKIVYLGFITYPENIISIDSEGFIYNWEYDQQFYELRYRSFRPKNKFKVNMETNYFEVVNNEKKQVYPDPKVTDNVDPQEKYIQYFENQDMKLLLEKPLKSGVSELLVCLSDLPQEQQNATFETITVHREQKKVISIVQQDYKAVPINGYVSQVKPSLVGQYLYLQVIKPHPITQDLIQIEFVGLNTSGFRLKKLKAEIQGQFTDKIDFEVVDNYYPFMISYLFINMPQGIVIMSLATGSVLKVIQDHLQIVKSTYQPKQLQPNGLQVIGNQSLFVSYKGSNGIWRFDINDKNDDDDKLTIYETARLEYEKLFRQ